ncbi:MAG: matrixin family metalloprotease [Phycisphaerales bacterium]|nr:matrixin family metalloprotease [Phycisphaerales bacterium]
MAEIAGEPACLGPCVHTAHGSTLLEKLMVASDELAPAGETPEQAACRREALLDKVQSSPLCFSPNSTPEQMARIVGMYDMLPPGLVMGTSDRFRTATTVWSGNSAQGASSRAARATLRYSFPPDGIAWGGEASPNDLNAAITARFGAGNVDRGRELIRQALAGWRRVAGLTYNEVNDSGSAFSTSGSAPATVGDIRIGSIPQDGVFGVLAYNFFPTGGGDMTLDTNDFSGSSFWSSSNNYRFLRNVAAHEHGHGLGYFHVVPCNDTKLMEPSASSAFDVQQIDEIRGSQRNYGDRFAGNNSAATATDFGNLTTPIVKSIVHRNLSTNGTAGVGGTGTDWFKFTLSSAQNVVVNVTPTGGSYTEGQQSSGCSGTTSTVVASQAGNLNVELRDAAGTTVVRTADAAGAAGVAETITFNSMPAGTYTVRVADAGPNANQTLQLYDLTVRVGTSKAPPQAIAGINKRIPFGQACYFMGNVNTKVNETGATLNNASYDWDLNGDGLFEVLDNPQPNRSYPANGPVSVTLRVTDSNGMSATDTILVTVYGATSSVAAVSPNSASPGGAIPVTITGVNLRSITSASQVSVSGSGVTVSGTPSVTFDGTTITGLSFVIAPAAPQSARNLTLTNADGAGQSVTLNNAFTVANIAPSNNECSAPIHWGSAGGELPFSNLGATTSPQQSFPNSGCPSSGPVNNDVWYTWTAPLTGSVSVTTDSVAAAPSFNSRVAVYLTASCPSGTTSLRGCDDFGFPFSIAVNQGQTLLFQVGSVVAGQTGSANVILSVAPFEGACCDSAGFCTIELLSACTGSSIYQGTGTTCQTHPCPDVEGTCCDAGGSCTFVFREDCGQGAAWTPGGACSPNPCAQPTGACCAAGGSCLVTEQSECAGTWMMALSCSPSPCPDAMGACCVGTTCTVGSPASCATASGQYQGDASACGQVGNPTTCCPANFNGQSGVTVQDIFDFLTAYFSADPSADVNQSEDVTVQDIFDFLALYFGGC